ATRIMGFMVRQIVIGDAIRGHQSPGFPLSLRRKAEWFAWIVVELLGTRLGWYWPQLQRCYSLMDLIKRGSLQRKKAWDLWRSSDRFRHRSPWRRNARALRAGHR